MRSSRVISRRSRNALGAPSSQRGSSRYPSRRFWATTGATIQNSVRSPTFTSGLTRTAARSSSEFVGATDSGSITRIAGGNGLPTDARTRLVVSTTNTASESRPPTMRPRSAVTAAVSAFDRDGLVPADFRKLTILGLRATVSNAALRWATASAISDATIRDAWMKRSRTTVSERRASVK